MFSSLTRGPRCSITIVTIQANLAHIASRVMCAVAGTRLRLTRHQSGLMVVARTGHALNIGASVGDDTLVAWRTQLTELTLVGKLCFSVLGVPPPLPRGWRYLDLHYVIFLCCVL